MGFAVKRDAVIRKLRQVPGRHIVLVRYSDEQHSVLDEWVYSADMERVYSADVDTANIVSARERAKDPGGEARKV